MPKKPYPPFFVIGGIVMTVILGFLEWPAFLKMNNEGLFATIGIVLCLLGLLAGIAVHRQFKEYETSIVPDHKPASLIKDGLFAYSRNPIYLSMNVILVGVSLWVGNGGGFIIALAFALWVRWRWIPLEEENMRAQFGSEFDDYCKLVRRWF